MIPLAVFGFAWIVCFIARSVVLRILDRRISDPLTFSHVLLDAIRFPSALWCIAAAIGIAIENAAMPDAMSYWAHKGIGIFLIISVTLVVAAVLARTIGVYGERRKIPFAIAGLSHTLAKFLVFCLGLLMVLRLFNITVTPLLTAFGVGGLAVALALQDSLANFFAGVHILIEQPIGLGDFIKLSSGEEGIVRDIGWRTTRIQSAGNNMTVIPNTKITTSTLTNYSVPDARVALDVPILAAHQADHNRIAEIALEIASSTKEVLAEPAPRVWFDPGITQTHLQMKLVVHVAVQSDGGVAQSTIRRRLLERFREENIPLPRPEGHAPVQ